MNADIQVSRETVLAVIISQEGKRHRNWTVSGVLKLMGIHGSHDEDLGYSDGLKAIRSRTKRILKDLAKEEVLEEVYEASWGKGTFGGPERVYVLNDHRREE